MKGYKGFEKGLVCRGKQYAENTVFEEDEAVICKKGMHFCKNPLDVLDYYPLVNENGEINEFAKVEAIDTPVTDDNSKYCSKKLKIGAKISFPALVQASVEFDFEKETKVKTSKRNNAKIGSSGDWAKIGSSGDGAQIGSSGYWAKIGSSGDEAKIGSSGYGAQIGSSGYGAVIMCAGENSIVKAKKGSWITLAEYAYVEGKRVPVCVKTEQVDGERIKAETFYKLVNGEFVEVVE